MTGSGKTDPCPTPALISSSVEAKVQHGALLVRTPERKHVSLHFFNTLAQPWRNANSNSHLIHRSCATRQTTRRLIHESSHSHKVTTEITKQKCQRRLITYILITPWSLLYTGSQNAHGQSRDIHRIQVKATISSLAGSCYLYDCASHFPSQNEHGLTATSFSTIRRHTVGMPRCSSLTSYLCISAMIGYKDRLWCSLNWVG